MGKEIQLSIAVVDQSRNEILCGIWTVDECEMEEYVVEGQAEFIWDFADHHDIEHPAQFMFIGEEKMSPMEASLDLAEYHGLNIGVTEVPGVFQSISKPTMEKTMLQWP